MNIDNVAGIRRTYELFDIVWEGGTKWGGLDTLEQAQATLEHGSRKGHIVRRSWTVDIPTRLIGIYNPGVGGDEILIELEFSHPMQSPITEEEVR